MFVAYRRSVARRVPVWPKLLDALRQILRAEAGHLLQLQGQVRRGWGGLVRFPERFIERFLTLEMAAFSVGWR